MKIDQSEVAAVTHHFKEWNYFLRDVPSQGYHGTRTQGVLPANHLGWHPNRARGNRTKNYKNKGETLSIIQQTSSFGTYEVLEDKDSENQDIMFFLLTPLPEETEDFLRDSEVSWEVEGEDRCGSSCRLAWEANTLAAALLRELRSFEG